jgi:hypothetical protein
MGRLATRIGMDAKYWLLGALAVSGMGMGDAAAQVTAADYERATMLGDRTARWWTAASAVYLAGRRQRGLWQVGRRQGRMAALDPATGASAPAFDQKALAAAIDKANPTGKPADADKLMVGGISARRGPAHRPARQRLPLRCRRLPRWRPTSGDEPGAASPDGSRAAFIRDWNLWVRDLASGKETQLTFDGQPDYGYATDNAGWKHTDEAILVWSPDGQKIATFQQDQRKTSSMTLVATNVGVPKVEQWKYPFVGDEHITMIERVVIDLSGDAPKTIRSMPPDQHRSTCSDDLACSWLGRRAVGAGRQDLAFVSTTAATSPRRCGWPTPPPARSATCSPNRGHQYQSAPALDSVNWRYLPESNEFLWFSQKSDWATSTCMTCHRQGKRSSPAALERRQRSRMSMPRRARCGSRASAAGRPRPLRALLQVGLDGGDVQLLTPETPP